MKGFLKVLAGVGIVTVCVLIIVSSSRTQNSPGSNSSESSSSPAVSEAANSSPSPVADPYNPNSNDVLDPNDLVKNPYEWKGHSGILDTIQMPIIAANGARMGFAPYPGGCMKFNKMLDEHTAIYEVMALDDGAVESEGELAVILKDSDPPSSARPWRIFVDGPMEAVNGLDQTITLTSVKFEGYFVPSSTQEGSSSSTATQAPADTGAKPPEETTPQSQPSPTPPQQQPSPPQSQPSPTPPQQQTSPPQSQPSPTPPQQQPSSPQSQPSPYTATRAAALSQTCY
jgi:hypothetical protein